MRKKLMVGETQNASVVTLWGTTILVPSKLTPKANKMLLDLVWDITEGAFIDNVYNHIIDFTSKSYKDFVETKYDDMLKVTFNFAFRELKKDVSLDIKLNDVTECYSKEVYECLFTIFKTILVHMANIALAQHAELEDAFLNQNRNRSLFYISKKVQDINYIPLTLDVNREMVNVLMYANTLLYFKGTEQEFKSYIELVKLININLSFSN